MSTLLAGCVPATRGRRGSSSGRSSSPWAPAAGCSDTRSMPHTSASPRSSRYMSSSAPCSMLSGAYGCRRAKPRQARGPLVDLGVVLHGARAERVDAEVDGEVLLAQAHEVTERLGLAHLGQRRRLAAERARRTARLASTSGTSHCGRLAPERPWVPRSKISGSSKAKPGRADDGISKSPRDPVSRSSRARTLWYKAPACRRADAHSHAHSAAGRRSTPVSRHRHVSAVSAPAAACRPLQLRPTVRAAARGK